MKLGEIVVHMDNYNFTKFHQNQMKNKKVLLIAHFSDQNFKVSVELWKSYIVTGVSTVGCNKAWESKNECTKYIPHDIHICSVDVVKFMTVQAE